MTCFLTIAQLNTAVRRLLGASSVVLKNTHSHRRTNGVNVKKNTTDAPVKLSFVSYAVLLPVIFLPKIKTVNRIN